jgi:AcrR family transcriptional regulator
MTASTTAAGVTETDRGDRNRRRIVAAAARLTTRSGWSAVTMTRLAEEVGVSRQTVYNEVGSKQALAEAMILDELERFLALVHRAFDDHPDDLVGSIRAAARGVLELARDDTLLRAVVSATHGADTELLPLLTTHARPLLSTAKAVIADRLAPFALPFDDRRRAAAIDVIVRVVLSHVMQPTDSPRRTADDVAWIAERLLRPPDD